MSQYDFGNIDPYVVDGVQLAGMLNQWRDAVYTGQRGAARPSFAVPGMRWIDDAAGAANWIIKFYTGPTMGDLPMFNVDTVAGTMALGAAMRAVTNANPADASKQVATDEFVQAAVQAAITSALAALLPTGTVIDLLGNVAAPSGWVLAMNGTIGSAASGATIRANADCANLFAHLWTLADTEAPVSGGRGVSAAADFGANKTIGGLDTRGVVRATFDSQGGTAAGRLSNLHPRRGVIAGEQATTLVEAHLAAHVHGPGSLLAPAHGHGITRGLGVPSVVTPRGVFGDGNGAGVAGYTENAGPWGLTGTTNSTGGNTPHNTTQPTRTVTTIIKL